MVRHGHAGETERLYGRDDQREGCAVTTTGEISRLKRDLSGPCAGRPPRISNPDGFDLEAHAQSSPQHATSTLLAPCLHRADLLRP